MQSYAFFLSWEKKNAVAALFCGLSRQWTMSPRDPWPQGDISRFPKADEMSASFGTRARYSAQPITSPFFTIAPCWRQVSTSFMSSSATTGTMA